MDAQGGAHRALLNSEPALPPLPTAHCTLKSLDGGRGPALVELVHIYGTCARILYT